MTLFEGGEEANYANRRKQGAYVKDMTPRPPAFPPPGYQAAPAPSSSSWEAHDPGLACLS